MLPPRYEPLTENVTFGGFGSVQRVRDVFLDREVLFKSMQDKNNNPQLINEIQALAKARSRHVVEIYDVIFDEENIVAGIIIEFLKGKDYKDFHLEASSDPNKYMLVIYQIATALADLHDAGVIHRDLKLDNLRDSTSGILKIFDFGISTIGDNYRTKNNRGTFVYAAPELYTPGVEITKEMDIYALGLCAWALASDALPSPLLERPPQQSGPPPSIASIMPGLPCIVSRLLDDCINPDPNQRPQARTLSQMLSRHLVQGRHKGIFVQGNQAIFELSHIKPNVGIKIGTLGELKVKYDGLAFQIVGVTGDVFVNNKTAEVGMELPDSCVLTYGDTSLGAQRQYVPFASSHPEVIL